VVLVLLRNDFPSPSGACCCPLIKEWGAERNWRGVILVSILINWLLLIWLSASLLFISQPDSLMNVETNSLQRL
jgi:hypothetical protein